MKVQGESVPQSTTPRRAGVPCCRASSLSSAGGGARKVPPTGGVWEPGKPTPWPSGPTSVCIRVLRLACDTCMCLLCACVHSVSVYVYMCHVQMCAWVCVRGCSTCVRVSACVYAHVCAYVCMRMRVYAGTSVSVCACVLGVGMRRHRRQPSRSVLQMCRAAGIPAGGITACRADGGGVGDCVPPCAHHLPNSAAPSPSALGFWAQVLTPRPRTWRSSAAEAWQPGR